LGFLHCNLQCLHYGGCDEVCLFPNSLEIRPESNAYNYWTFVTLQTGSGVELSHNLKFYEKNSYIHLTNIFFFYRGAHWWVWKKKLKKNSEKIREWLVPNSFRWTFLNTYPYFYMIRPHCFQEADSLSKSMLFLFKFVGYNVSKGNRTQTIWRTMI
jgi:hypothetical protein